MSGIYIAGIRGLVGANLRIAAERRGLEVHGKSSSDLDFLDRKATESELKSVRPEVLVIAAAKVGGIGANSLHPVEFLTRNLQIQCNLIDGAYAAGIEKVIFLGSSCIYPKFAEQPIKESAILTGQLEVTNQAYAIAKIAGIELINSYRKEYEKNWFSLMPCNLYGPRDNFDTKSSHVLAALMRKIHEAKESHAKTVEIWGDGTPTREFLYVEDAAEGILHFVSGKNPHELVNLGSGNEISISGLATLIASIVGYEGEFTYNASQPSGTPRKVLNVQRMLDLGWSASTPLAKGIEQTYSWYIDNLAGIEE
jgi:GDP-L-fucose synthase